MNERDKTLSRERNRDLLRAYREVIEEAGENAPFISSLELANRAVNKQPKKFYITPEYARRVINDVMITEK